MSHLIFVIGESGTGKSTSIKTLNAAETCLINVANKPLPFKGNSYSVSKKNYAKTDSHQDILGIMSAISNNCPNVKSIVIDDFQYLMANEFMKRAMERGYDKFTEIALHAFSVLEAAMNLRDDLFVFVMSHSEQNDRGKIKLKTIGKMLDEKITLEGLATCVFHSVLIDGHYKFLTQFDGTHIAKSPMGMFNETYIDNDLNAVKNSMINYYSGDDENAIHA